jgi:hypothetical protein
MSARENALVPAFMAVVASLLAAAVGISLYTKDTTLPAAEAVSAGLGPPWGSPSPCRCTYSHLPDNGTPPETVTGASHHKLVADGGR